MSNNKVKIEKAEVKADKEKELQQKIYPLEKELKRLQQSVKMGKYGLVWMDVLELPPFF